MAAPEETTALHGARVDVDEASPKQLVYRELLEWALPYLRNIATLPWWQRYGHIHAVRFETELIHNLYVSMFHREFTDHDIWFLNHQARVYCEQCSASISPRYIMITRLLGQLFALVLPARRAQLEWSGPSLEGP